MNGQFKMLASDEMPALPLKQRPILNKKLTALAEEYSDSPSAQAVLQGLRSNSEESSASDPQF